MSSNILCPKKHLFASLLASSRKLSKDSSFGDEVIVGSTFNTPLLIHHQNQVRIANRGKSVGNYQHRPPTPILALTANAFREEVGKSLAVGCTAHLTKPIKKQILLDAIATHTKKGPAQQAA